jgi:eukaryotic-like serine/threonine-protein kinase
MPPQGTPPWPVQPGPYQPAWTAPGTGQPRTPRWPFVLLAGALVAAAAVVAVALVWHAGNTPSRNAASNTSNGIRQSTPATGQSSPSPSVAPTSAGWTQYQDPSGFSVQLPPGWAVSSATRTGRYPGVYFTGPDPGYRLFVSWSRQTGTDALASCQSQAASFARNVPTYQLIELQQVTYRTYNSAVWEFTNENHGVLTQDIDFQFVVRPHVEGYAIELYGPQADWSSVYGSIWNNILATFKPAP